jgi:hypothetical protein
MQQLFFFNKNRSSVKVSSFTTTKDNMEIPENKEESTITVKKEFSSIKSQKLCASVTEEKEQKTSYYSTSEKVKSKEPGTARTLQKIDTNAPK